MENPQFKSLLKEIKEGIKINKNVIDKAIREELSKGVNVRIEKILEVIDSYEKVEVSDSENETFAVSYSGNPEITITYMIDSVLYNNKVILCANGSKIINEVLYTIFTESLNGCKLKNQWVDYNSNYNEIFLRDNQDKFDKLIYIGDYFEYEKFKYFFNKDVEYNNFGYIKLFIDKTKYQEEYKKIFKFTYLENIALEVYDDPDDFINESREQDYSIIFGDLEEINKIKRGLRAGTLLINAFPYDSYKFQIER